MEIDIAPVFFIHVPCGTNSIVFFAQLSSHVDIQFQATSVEFFYVDEAEPFIGDIEAENMAAVFMLHVKEGHFFGDMRE